jgi:hypothetical protein
MRTVIRLQALGLLIAAVPGAWWLRSAGATAAVAIRSNVQVRGAMPEQLAMAQWAVNRFEAAGLEPPTVKIEFHGDPSGCGGRLGFARQGEVDVCNILVNTMSRRVLLHEMSHIWLDENVGASARAEFLELRELGSWNASGDPWELRGYEQGAEIIAWTIGERILTPWIPDNDPPQIASAYEVLTGKRFGERSQAVSRS